MVAHYGPTGQIVTRQSFDDLENVPVLFASLWLRLRQKIRTDRQNTLERILREPDSVHTYVGAVHAYDTIIAMMAELESEDGVTERKAANG